MLDSIFYLLLAAFVILMVRRMLPLKGLGNVTPDELMAMLKKTRDYQFIDVREPFEYKRGTIQGFRNIPLSQLPQAIKDLDRTKPVVLTCQSGMRSRQAAKLLMQQGFTDIRHLPTGLSGWNRPLAK